MLSSAPATPLEAALSPPLQRLIDRFETQTTLCFKPSRRFYQRTGINRLRFAQFLRGQKHPDSREIKTLIHFFNQFFPVKAEDLL
ncbi:hypothetical protein [Spirosoma endbachense]|uniref:XRE family transcriptional regulator n=1 Tax=Spirosoma endbachense TaxID=2666025 RepID=A0A6P1W0R8_9BACT|nr:hypothetical protein [Spirosoma endbachense]QHV97892.1 hypothetical protein GJR95_24070 [Spirosoma endbachense]